MHTKLQFNFAQYMITDYRFYMRYYLCIVNVAGGYTGNLFKSVADFTRNISLQTASQLTVLFAGRGDSGDD